MLPTTLRLLIACALVLGFLHDLLPHPSYQPPWGDLIYFHFLWEAGRTIWRTYGQMPFWNPYHCGGMVELANPHSMAWSPFFAPALVFDAGTGVRAFIILHFVAAFLGAWLWARGRRLPDPWAIAPAIAFTMNGFFPARSAGHLSFLPFAWLPWMLLCYERARAERRFAYLLGALVALCVYDGAPYPTAFSILLIAVLTARDLAAIVIQRARGLPAPALGEPVRIALVAAVAFFLIAAFKLFPVLEFFRAYPRLIPQADDSLGLRHLVAVVLYRPFTRQLAGYTWAFDEYRDYLGPVVIGGAALTLARGRARWGDLVVAVFFISLMLGNHGPGSPYVLLHRLPGFDSQRVPSRFAILVIPFLGLWFGQALADIAGPATGHPRWRPRALVAALMLVVASVDLGSINATMLHDWFTVPPPAASANTLPRSGFSQVFETGASWITSYLRAPVDGYGYVACELFEPDPVRPALSLHTKLLPQVEIRPPGAGQARLLTFTPNRLEVAVELHADAQLIVNQNFFPGWTSDAGPTVDREGRIAVMLPAGQRTVGLTYRPLHASLYATLTLAGLAGLALALRRPRRAEAQTTVATTAIEPDGT